MAGAPQITLRRLGRDYAWSISFWLISSVLVAWQEYIQFGSAHLKVRLQDFLILYGVRYLTVGLLTPPLFYITERWPVSAAEPGRVIAYALGFMPFSVTFATIRWCLLPPWREETQSWGPRSLELLAELCYRTFADLWLLYLSIIIAAHAYSYFWRSRRQEIERLELRQALAQAELQALKAQLHPHFLFNTLQGISTLIDTDREVAKSMVLTLGTLLRTALQHGSVDLVPLREELEFIRSYLDVESMRLGKRLTIRWNIAPESRDALVPHLILQPLVENAVVHGIACSREGGWMELQATPERSRLRVTIRNSVGGRSRPGLGVGIQNTRARLRHLYSEDATFDFRIGSDAVATTTLSVPAFTEPAVEISRAAGALAHG